MRGSHLPRVMPRCSIDRRTLHGCLPYHCFTSFAGNLWRKWSHPYVPVCCLHDRTIVHLKTNSSFTRPLRIGILVVHDFYAVDPVFEAISAGAEGHTVPVVGIVHPTDRGGVRRYAQ